VHHEYVPQGQTEFTFVYRSSVGWNNIVSIQTHDGMDSPGTESWWGKIFCTYPEQPWGLCSLLYNGDQVYSLRVKQPERGVDHPSPSSLLWSRVLLEKLNGSLLVKKFPAFYGTQRFITMFTSTQPPSGTQVTQRV